MAVLSSIVSLHSDGCSRHRSYAVTLTATSFAPYHRFLKRGTGAMNAPVIWIDISLDQQKYVGFSWPLNGVLWYLAFLILVFGLVKRLLLLLLLLFFHLKRTSTAGSFYWPEGAYFSGFLIGKEKSHRGPILVSEWLGFAVCTICFTF